MSRGKLFPLRFLKEGSELDEPSETAGEVFQMYDLGAGITENRGKHLFLPPAIPDVACKFSVIPEICFHKGQDRPNILVTLLR